MKHQATIKEIAFALGVSVSTVSRALQNDSRIGLRTKQRVNDLAQKMHYVPNPAAKLLRKNRTYTVGVLLPYLTEEFFSMAITGIEDIIAEKGYNVFISQSRDSLDRERKAIRSFINSRVDGVIVSISAGTTDYAHFEELQAFGIPVVFFDRIPKDFPSHQVRCNVVEGVKEAMRFLVGRGITQIALLNGPDNLGISQERQQGYQSIVEEFGLKIPANFVKNTDLTQEDTFQKMRELCGSKVRPAAILTFNDYIALHAIQWCKQNGIVPNRDIVFVSFANLPITTYMDTPPLASVEQFAYQLGEKAAELLMEILDAPNDAEDMAFREVVVETKLALHEQR